MLVAMAATKYGQTCTVLESLLYIFWKYCCNDVLSTQEIRQQFKEDTTIQHFTYEVQFY